jgi:lipopolysaccharide export system protein LptC
MAVAGPGNFHSRLVAWLKILLPLAALALLSTLFLVARRIDPSDAIPYAEVDLEDRLREPKMTGAVYAGTTRDGTAIRLSTDSAVPLPGGRARARGLSAAVETPDGARTTIRAASAEIGTRGRSIALSGTVEVSTSSGYRVTTDDVLIDRDTTSVTVPGTVEGTGPGGAIRADSLTLTSAESDAGSYLLTFSGDVRLLYRPEK